MFAEILNSKTKTINSAAILLFFSALFSRLLGLLRDNLLASRFPKNETDIYFAAFQIPDLVYNILINAGIIVTFLPVLAEKFKEGPDEAKRLINTIFTFFLFGLVFTSLILSFFSPQLAKIIAPGFSFNQQSLTVQLTRIMFLSPIFLGLSAIFSTVLQCFNLFFTIAMAPLLYNLGIISGILFLTPILGLSGLAWGVILGAFLHFFIQFIPLLTIGFFPRFSFNFKIPALKKIIFLTIPRTIGVAAYQLNLIIMTAIASLLSPGAISIFNFSNNLQYVPIGLIGLSFATASFPHFSKIFIEKDKEKFSENFVSIFSRILFLIIPLSCLVFLFRNQLTQLILGTSISGQSYFSLEQIKLTSACLGIFSLFLFAPSLIPFLSRTFCAIQNTKIPMLITISSMSLNALLCFLFIWVLSFSNFIQQGLVFVFQLENFKDISVISLVLSYSISVVIHFFLLVFALKKKIEFLEIKKIYLVVKKILFAAFLMTILVYSILCLFSLFVKTQTFLGILFQLSITSLAACFSYFVFAFLLKIKDAQYLLLNLKKWIKFI